MSSQHPDRVLFITGGAQGIGRACVEAFLEDNYAIGVLDCDASALEALPQTPNLLSFHADTTHEPAVQKALQATHAHFGRLDVLLPNAAIHEPGALWELSAEAFQKVLNVNLMGVFHVLKHGLPYLPEHDHGTVILMGSDQCLRARTRSAAYGASKGALAQMTRALALDLAPKGIRVNILCPSTIDTALTRSVLKRLYPDTDPASSLEAHAQAYPLGRLVQAHEVAHWARILSDPRTPFTTGTTVPIEGGLTS